MFQDQKGRGRHNALGNEGRFIDALCSFLEEYVGVGAKTISLEVQEWDRPTLTVSSEVGVELLGPEKKGTNHWRFELAGARMREVEELPHSP